MVAHDVGTHQEEPAAGDRRRAKLDDLVLTAGDPRLEADGVGAVRFRLARPPEPAGDLDRPMGLG